MISFILICKTNLLGSCLQHGFQRKGLAAFPVPHFMPSQRILGSVGIVHFSMEAGGGLRLMYFEYFHFSVVIYYVCEHYLNSLLLSNG